jgi:hypothetical protein
VMLLGERSRPSRASRFVKWRGAAKSASRRVDRAIPHGPPSSRSVPGEVVIQRSRKGYDPADTRDPHLALAQAREVGEPAADEPLLWRLITTLPATSLAEAAERCLRNFPELKRSRRPVSGNSHLNRWAINGYIAVR